MSSEDSTRRTADRMLAAGHSRERAIADLVLDAALIDRQKTAVARGLLDTSAHDATRKWVRAEMLHAISFERRWAKMDPEELRAEFKAALSELGDG